MASMYWFRARRHGVGWTPSSWQGWTVLALYVGLLTHSFFQIEGQSHSVSDTLINFFPRFLIFTALLTIITYLKGEPTTWHHHPDHVKTLEDKNEAERFLKEVQENK